MDYFNDFPFKILYKVFDSSLEEVKNILYSGYKKTIGIGDVSFVKNGKI